MRWSGCQNLVASPGDDVPNVAEPNASIGVNHNTRKVFYAVQDFLQSRIGIDYWKSHFWLKIGDFPVFKIIELAAGHA